MASFIYKPGTPKGPVVLIPSTEPRGTVTITTPDGRTFTGRYLNTNEGRHQYVFPREIVNYQDLDISAGDQSGTIADGRISYEGSNFSDWQPRPKGSLGPQGTPAGGPNPTGASVGTGPEGVQFPIPGTAPSFPTVSAQPIPQIDVPFVDPVKPLEASQKYSAANVEQLATNFGISKDQAEQLVQLDFDTLSKYFPAVSGLQKEAIRGENAFNIEEAGKADVANEAAIRRANTGNQADRLKQLEAALPGARSTILKQIENNKTLSEGRFLSDAEDRAYEVASRSSAADEANVRGFGDDSTVGKRTSDLLSAAKRLDLTQIGQAGLDRFLTLGANLAFDQPIKFNPIHNDPLKSKLSQDLRAPDPNAASKTTMAQESRIDPLTTLSPATGVSAEITGVGQEIGQNQFQAGLTQQTNQFNSSQGVQVQEFNAQGTYQAGVEQFTADVFAAQQEAGATNQGHAIDTAQDNFETSAEIGAAGEIIGTAVTVGAMLLKPNEAVSSTTPAEKSFSDLGPAGKPFALALASSGSGKSPEQLAKDGVSDSDVRRGLMRTSAAGKPVASTKELFKDGVTAEDVRKASLLTNPMTGALAAYDMLGEQSGREAKQGERNALRKYGSQTGLFFKGTEKSGLEEGAYYARLADGSSVKVSNDGKKKLPNHGVNIDGKTERFTYQVDWSDPRAQQSVGYYNALGRMVFGKNWQSMAGHVVNAAMSNNNSLVETKANFRSMADDANINYRTGLKLLSQYKATGEIPKSQYAAIVAGWNDLMLSSGVTRSVSV